MQRIIQFGKHPAEEGLQKTSGLLILANSAGKNFARLVHSSSISEFILEKNHTSAKYVESALANEDPLPRIDGFTLVKNHLLAIFVVGHLANQVLLRLIEELTQEKSRICVIFVVNDFVSLDL